MDLISQLGSKRTRQQAKTAARRVWWVCFVFCHAFLLPHRGSGIERSGFLFHFYIPKGSKRYRGLDVSPQNHSKSLPRYPKHPKTRSCVSDLRSTHARPACCPVASLDLVGARLGAADELSPPESPRAVLRSPGLQVSFASEHGGKSTPGCINGQVMREGSFFPTTVESSLKFLFQQT